MKKPTPKPTTKIKWDAEAFVDGARAAARGLPRISPHFKLEINTRSWLAGHASYTRILQK